MFASSFPKGPRGGSFLNVAWFHPVLLAAVCLALGAEAHASSTFTASNSVFPSTPVGQSTTQTVTVTLNSAVALQSIAIPAEFTEFAAGTITGCTISSFTVDSVGTVCSVPVTFTPKAPGSTVSPGTARTAPLLVTDIESGNPVVYAFGLMGAATGPVMMFTPATLTRVAGAANTSYAAGDQGLGSTTSGYSGNNGPATSATFSFYSVFDISQEPLQPMAIDSAGNLFVIDTGNNIIRRIDGTTGTTTVLAGTQGSAAGDSGDGAAATSAVLGSENSLVLDAADDLYFINQGNTTNAPSSVIRRVDGGTGIITSVAGQGFVVADEGGTNCPTTVSTGLPFQATCGDGGLAANAYIYEPVAIAMDAAGDIFILQDAGNVRKINATTGNISEVGNMYTNGTAWGLTLAADGNLYGSVYDSSLTAYVIKQMNPSSGTTTVVMGGTGNQPNTTTCIQTGSAATSWVLDPNASVTAGLSADGSGNIYGITGYCSAGSTALESASAIGSFRLNVATGLAYGYTDVYQEGSGAGGNNGVFESWLGLYQILPVFSVADSAGNIYFQTFNQIAKLSGSAGALDGYTSRDDFATDTAGTSCSILAASISTIFCQTAAIANVGNSDLNLSASLTDTADFAFLTTNDSSACSGATVAPGDYCDLDVEFTPTTVGTITGDVSISDNSPQGSGTQLLALVGTGVAEPEVTLTLTSPVFGTVPDGSSGTETFSLANPGTGPLTIYSAFTTIQSPNLFTESDNCPKNPSTLAAGGSCTITVTFTPQSTSGTYTNTLTVDESVGTGTVTAALTANAGSIAAAGASLSPSPLAFSGQIVNTTSGALSATLSNTGSATLTGIAPSLTGANPSDFAVTTGTNACGSSLAAGSSCNIYITFTPASAAGFTATLSVADSASGSPQTVSLTGTGVTFASNVGTAQATQTMAVYIATAGTLNSIQLLTQGAANLDFTETTGGSCATGTAYAVGQSCTVNVVFKPQYSGVRNGAILLSDASGDVLATTYLPGAATGPQIVFAPGSQTNLLPNSTYSPAGVAVDGSGDIFVVDTAGGAVIKLPKTGSGYGAPVTIGSGYNQPFGVAVDGAGNVYVGGYANQELIKIPWTGSAYGPQTTVPLGSTTREPRHLSVDGRGNIYFADYAFDVGIEVPWTGSGYGTPITLPFTGLSSINDVLVDGNGDVFAANTYAHNIVELPWTGSAYGTQITVASNLEGGVGNPIALALDPGGDLFVAEQYSGFTGTNSLLKIPFTGGTYGTPITISVSNLDSIYDVALDGAGNILVADFLDQQVYKLDVTDAPSLSFASTNVGSTSTDSPKTVTVSNIGNAALTFTAGTNPSYPTNFPENTADTSLCGTASPLASTASCDVSVNFEPASSGPLSGDIVLTDNNLNGNGVTQSIAVSGTGTGGLTAQAITFTQPTSPVTYAPGLTIALMATGGASGNPVIFTLDESSTGSGSVSGSTLTVTGVGSFVIDANQAGNSSYSAAPLVQRTVVVNQAAQAISFTQPTSPATYAPGLTIALAATGGASGNPVAFTVDASSSGKGSISGSTLTVTGAGNIVIDANQAGNGNYSAAPQVQRTVVVNLAAQAIAFTQPTTPVTYSSGLTIALSATGGASGNPVVFTVDASSTGKGSISGSTLTVTSAGTFVIDANQAGNTNYSAAPQVQISVVVNAAAAADFTIAATPATQSVASGAAATYTVTVGSSGGSFNSAVTFTATGLPTGATASFSPAQVTPGASTATSTMTVDTPAIAATQPLEHSPRWPFATPVLAFFFLLPFRRWRRAWIGRFLLLAIALASLAATASLSACGGGFGFGAQSQTYTLTVTGASGSDTHSTTVQLTVQ